MTGYVIAGACVVLVLAFSELRLMRWRRAERLRAIEQLARAAGIGPAIGVARELGWIGEGDVKSDGDNVQIRLRRWRLLRR